MMGGSGIRWTICKSFASTTQVPHHSVFFTDQMLFLPPNQQHQSLEGTAVKALKLHNTYSQLFV